MIFNEADYAKLHTLFDLEGYKGYRPDMIEAPNGDGKWDTGKRYLHVNLKYDPPRWAQDFMARAHFEACKIAEAMKVPDVYYPRVENGTLRVLEYPPGTGTAEHVDYDLFTLHCYRSSMSDFIRLDPVDPRAEAIDPHCHLGELGELVGLGKSTRHWVPGQPYPQQAIVYFAWPAFDAVLPSGLTARAWLAERSSRSLAYK